MGGSESLSEFAAQTLEFTVGNGDVCDALEMAVVAMKKGEQAVVTCTNPTLVVDEKLGLKDLTGDKVLLTLKLTDFEKAKEHYDMNEEEKVGFGGSRKEVGSTLFKKGRIALALERYKKVAEMFSYTDNIKDESAKAKAKDLKMLCELNKAACFLKLKEYADAKKSCELVLKEQSINLKAMFRKAQACYEMKEIQDCIQVLKRLLETDPQNREARTLLKRAHEAQKEEDKKSKGLYTDMCKALGKGPIPEAPKAKGYVGNNTCATKEEACGCCSAGTPADGELKVDGAEMSSGADPSSANTEAGEEGSGEKSETPLASGEPKEEANNEESEKHAAA